MDSNELLTKLSAAFKDMQAKSAARDKASNDFSVADQSWKDSATALAALRDEASTLIGALVQPVDPRFRKSA